MNNFESLYDYPMSHGCWRAICQLNGQPVPPNVGGLSYIMTEEEHKQSFDRMQELWRNGIYPALHENVEEMYQQMITRFSFQESSPIIKSAQPVLTHQPMYKKQDNSNSGVGRRVLGGEGRGISNKKNLSIPPKRDGF